MTNYPDQTDQLDQLRALLPTIDPAALDTADKMALLALLAATMGVRMQ